jgi:hypothetical protein
MKCIGILSLIKLRVMELWLCLMEIFMRVGSRMASDMVWESISFPRLANTILESFLKTLLMARVVLLHQI